MYILPPFSFDRPVSPWHDDQGEYLSSN
jgi:hypothetical protein